MFKQRSGRGCNVRALARIEDNAHIGYALLLKDVDVQFLIRSGGAFPVDLSLKIAGLIVPDAPKINPGSALSGCDWPSKPTRLGRTYFYTVELRIARRYNQPWSGSVHVRPFKKAETISGIHQHFEDVIFAALRSNSVGQLYRALRQHQGGR